MPSIDTLSSAVGKALPELKAFNQREQWRKDPERWAREVTKAFLWSKQREIALSVRDNPRTAVRSSNNAGKDLPLDTPLPTPTGWTTMGEVQVGNYVLDEMGNPTRVLTKSEVFHNPLYRITFNDGATVVCSDTHQWDTIDSDAIGNKWDWGLAKTRTTKELRESELTHHIPINRPFNLPAADLPEDPYAFGSNLGDKRIPLAYLRASEQQRRDLLRGILDAGDAGQRDDIDELVRSLGDGPRYRTISKIESVTTVPTQCISVDSPRHLYLATKWMIPTHNTMIAGLIGAWFIATNDPHDTIVVCTAPAFAQIKTNLFYEFGKNIRLARENNADLPGYITVGQNIAEWKLSDGTQLAIGRRPPDKDAATSFIGIHRANVLVILDEAGGTPPELFNLAERITTTGNARILAIGNPDRLGSEFHKMFKDGSDWTQIHINGLETPNFTKDRVAPYPVLREYMESNNFPYSTEEFPDDLRQYMLQPKWVDRQLRVLPPGDARWKIWILGEFPDTDDMVFFPESVINRALEADIEDDSDIPLILGVDLARFGEDSSVIYTNRGGRIRKHSEWSKTNAVESANRVHQAATELGAKYVNIDASGLGGPIIDNILTMGGKYSVVQMNGAGSSPDPRRWLNARAWWYDGLREKMTAGEVDLDLDDKELLDEARDINAEFTDRGAIKVEGKKDLKARTGGSPDHLDATVYASYNPEDNVSTPKKERQYQDPSDIIGDIPNYLRLMTDWA